MHTNSASTHLRGLFFVTLAATLWGVSGGVAKFFLTQNLPPFLLVQVRLGLSAGILLLTLRLFAPQLVRLRRQDIGYVAIWGILGMAMVQTTYLLAISATNVATAIFLQSTSPILTALYAWLFERQRLSPLLLACLALAMGGSFLLIFGGTTTLMVSPLGLAAGIGSALAAAFHTIYGARGVTRDLSPWTILGYGLGFGFLFWLLLDLVAFLAGHPVADPALLASPSLWIFFLYLGTVATILPFGFYLVGLKWIAPTQATIIGMLEPVMGGVTAYFIVGEVLGPIQLLGGALILAAVVLLQSGKRP